VLLGALLALLVGLLGTGCAKAPAESSSGSGGSDTSAAATQAMKFAGCMRDNGVDAFPDPDASGELTIDGVVNRSSLDVSSAGFERAMTACRDLEPSGFTGHERTPQQQEAALGFARCIRENGVGDFPDPTADAPMIDTNLIPSAARAGGMDRLHAAMEQCRGKATAAGVTGR
jgi:hypothetical protein